MQVVSIEKDREHKGNKVVHLSDGSSFTASEESIFKYAIYEYEEYEDEKLGEIVFNVKTDDAYSQVLLYVYNRRRTKHEVSMKLSQKGFTHDVIERVIEIFVEKEYLDDRKYADLYIKNAKKMSLKSRRYISYELGNKGVSSHIVESALASFEDDDNDVALKVVQKKYKKIIQNGKLTRDDIVKIKRYLYGKAFTSGNIRYAIENMNCTMENDDE